MCADWRGPWGEDPEGEGAPGDSRPFGTRPFGTRPFGTRPFGTRPFGTRPFGTRPFGTRPFGTRPFGTRPFGTRPFGTRPFGTRPFGTRDDDSDGTLDAAEWSADIAELFCQRSAAIRLGARVVSDDREVPVPAVEAPVPPFSYLSQPQVTDPAKNRTGVPKRSARKPESRMSQRLLRPRDHELALKVILPNEIVRDFAEYPELALSAKDDIACRLAVRADAAFLRGTPVANEPLGILNSAGVANQLVPPAGAPAPDLLAPARNMVASRLLAGALFKAAGWILHPGTLAELTTLTTTDFQTRNVGGGEALDRTRLLTYDGADGGEFLGYPFLVSTAVGGPNDMVFSADWGEAWIGVDRDVVAVDISTEANFETDETVVRCVMHHDFVVRTPGAFIYAI